MTTGERRARRWTSSLATSPRWGATPPVGVAVHVMGVRGGCGATRFADRVTLEMALPMHACSAWLTFSRRPVMVVPASEAADEPVLVRVLFSVAVDSGHEASSSAAAPATCGVAIDVPLMYP